VLPAEGSVAIHGGSRVINVADPPAPDFVFNDVNYSTTLHRIRELTLKRGGGVVALGPTGRAELELLLRLIENNIEIFAPRSLSSVTSSLVALGLNTHQLFDVVAEQAILKMTEFNHQDLASLSWSYARAGQNHEELFRAIDVYARKTAPYALGPDLTTIIWSFAKTGFGTPSLFAIFEQSYTKLLYLNSQSLATVLWSWAKLGIPSPTLFSFVEKKMLGQLRSYDLQTISNIIWAYGRSGTVSKELLTRLCAQALQKVDDLRPQHFANIAWSLSVLKFDSPDLMRAIRSRAIRRINDFTPLSLSEIATAYSSLTQPPDPMSNPLFLAIAKRITDMRQDSERVKVLPTPIACELASSYARQGGITDPFLQFLSNQISAQVTTNSSMTPKNAMKASWGHFQLNRSREGLLALLEPRVEAFTDALDDPSLLASSVWALSFFRIPSQSLLTKAITHLNRLPPASLSEKSLVYLYHLDLAASKGQVSLPVPLSKELRAVAREAFYRHEKAFVVGQAAAVDDAAQYLRQFLGQGLREKLQVNTTSPEGFGLQLAIPEKKFVFELLPNHHFIEDLFTENKWASGESRVRSDLLKKHGWKMASLHHLAWVTLKPEKKQELARRVTAIL